MTYRYSGIDIIVGFGMCAIVFGALFLFVATTGTFLVATPPAMDDQFSSSANGMVWLQPALGQAIVERTLLQRLSDRITAQATLEWDQALLAHYSLQSLPGGPFGFIMDRAATMPDDHAARVQAVMGRSIVNGTRRGVRSGVLSADQYLSDYNRDMIGTAEQLGGRMHGEFMATWQPLLGRWIVDAGRDYAVRAAASAGAVGCGDCPCGSGQDRAGRGMGSEPISAGDLAGGGGSHGDDDRSGRSDHGGKRDADGRGHGDGAGADDGLARDSARLFLCCDDRDGPGVFQRVEAVCHESGSKSAGGLAARA